MSEAAFYGAVTAMAMHEMQNVLAVIQQSAGLMSDYLEASRRESIKTLGFRKGFSHHDKFKELIGTINEQIGRGTDLADRLGRLAHAPDDAKPRSDPGELAEFLFTLLGSMARKKRVRFELERKPGPTLAGCPPLVTVMALFAPTRAFPQGGQAMTVRVVVGEEQGAPVVEFIPPADCPGEALLDPEAASRPIFPGDGPHGAPGPCLSLKEGRIRVTFPPYAEKAESAE